MNGNDTEQKLHENLESHSSWLGLITYSYIQDVLTRGREKPLQYTDLQNMVPPDKANASLYEFTSHWEATKKDERPSLLMALYKSWKSEYLVAISLSALFSICLGIGPIALKYIVLCIHHPQDYTLLFALCFAMLLCLPTIVGTIVVQRSDHIMNRLALRVRGALVLSIYKKSLKLSAEAKLRWTTGEISNLIAVDCQRVCDYSFFINWVGNCVILFSIAIITFSIEIGWSFIPGLIITALSVYYAFSLCGRMVSAEEERSLHSSQRLKLMGEVFSGIRVLKLYSWEKFFLKKLQECRDTEIKPLTSMYIIKALAQTVSSATNYIVASVIIFAYITTSDDPDSTSPARIFTILGILQSIRIPLIILPMLIPSFSQLIISMHHVESFLLEEERDEFFMLETDDNVEDEDSEDSKKTLVRMTNGSFEWSSQQIENKEEKEEEKKIKKEGDKVEELNGIVIHYDADNDDDNEKEEEEEGKKKEKIFQLRDLSFNIKQGELVMVVGALGSGKSSLIEALLGNMTAINTLTKVYVNPNKKLALVSQTPWILNTSLKQNITITNTNNGDDDNNELYNECMSVCALLNDLDTFVDGDETEIGERGHNLSGGQKQRVSLARAVYSQADIYLLDDPLSAVDAEVSQHIFNKCINGTLKNKTRILVTNQLHYLPLASQILVLEQGKIVQHGTYENLTKHIHFEGSVLQMLLKEHKRVQESLQEEQEKKEEKKEIVHLVKCYDIVPARKFMRISKDKNNKIISKVVRLCYNGEMMKIGCISKENNNDDEIFLSLTSLCDIKAFQMALKDYKNIYEEYYNNDNIKDKKINSSKLIVMEFKNNTDNDNTDNDKINSHQWCLIADNKHVVKELIVEIQQLLENNIKNINVKWNDKNNSVDKWNNKEDTKKAKSSLVEEEMRIVGAPSWSIYARYFSFGLDIILLILFFFLETGANIATDLWLASWTSNSSSHTNTNINNQQSDLFYMLIFLVFVAGHSLMVAGGRYSAVYFVSRTIKKLHQDMLESVLAAPLHFFDSTPLGRIISRFSRDVNVVDLLLPNNISDIYSQLEHLFVACVLSVFATPYMMIAFVILFLFYYYIQGYYRHTARELQRLESIYRSPMISLVIESVCGDVTIRAYDLTHRVFDALVRSLDANSTTLYMQRTVERWLAMRLEIIGGLIGIFTGFIAVLHTYMTYEDMSEKQLALTAGFTGLALGYSLSLPGSLNWLIRQAIELETRMNAVERIIEYTDLPREEEEKDLSINYTSLPKLWPSKGHIKIKKLTLRYMPHLPPVLKNLSLEIKGGEKVGIVGRTGAGKSTLISTLFRLVEIPLNTIFIDGIDIRTLSLSDLRSNLTIIPQDPHLFKGTLRSNIDIQNKYTNNDVDNAIKLAQLDDLNRDSIVEQNGVNFSHGQRQLVCLARALLSGSKLLILDEATSSVDNQTDTIIQQAVRTHFQNSTVISIAHRIHTILDCDRVIVMLDGTIAESGSPRELLQSPTSYFAHLVAHSMDAN